MKETLTAAYGSNMSKAQMAYRCPDAELLGASELKDWRLLFKGSHTGRYATIEPCEGCAVPLLVWRISQRDEASLDRYEGVAGGFYRKELVRIPLDGKTVEAMVYVMDERRSPGIPEEWYYSVIEDAYLEFGFDTSILEKALDDSMEEAAESGSRNGLEIACIPGGKADAS